MPRRARLQPEAGEAHILASRLGEEAVVVAQPVQRRRHPRGRAADAKGRVAGVSRAAEAGERVALHVPAHTHP